jgi:cytochrome c oxidase subunit 1
LLVVGSWGWSWDLWSTYRQWKREHVGEPVPLAVHGLLANVVVWALATVGVALEMLLLLIPWSLGWVPTVDPVLARTLFWWFGHPLVYFWLLPAYVIWYTLLPRAAGGKLFSDGLGRMVFILFVLFSTPVGLHHQFMDPGVPALFKLGHTLATYVILFPSFVTAFTVIASLETAGRARGGRGLFSWIGRLPWEDPFVTSVVLAMLVFAIGGFGGAINAAYAMNTMVHNTAWVQGHFHLTVGTAVALTFMGVTYHLLPRLLGRELKLRGAAQVQPWLWFIGMMLFAVVNHVTGILGMPRRVYEAGYQGSAVASRWSEWTSISAAGGVVLFISAMLYVLVVVATVGWGRPLAQPPALQFAQPLDPAGVRQGPWERWGLWVGLAVALVAIAYLYPIVHHLMMPRFGSPPFRQY